MKSTEDRKLESELSNQAVAYLNSGNSKEVHLAGAALAFSLAALRFADAIERIATALEKETGEVEFTQPTKGATQ